MKKEIQLTPKELQLFKFIENYQLKHGASPTVREMRGHMKLKSDGFVVHCLKSLVEKGVIQKGDTPRSIKLLPKVQERLDSGVTKIPVLGAIPAGGPVISDENVEDWVSFGADELQNPSDCFILKVRGDSMIGAGIFEGDFVIANSKATPREGDFVIALVDGGSTVKRYMRSGRQIFLRPENAKYKDIYPESDLQVQGVVVGLLRWY